MSDTNKEIESIREALEAGPTDGVWTHGPLDRARDEIVIFAKDGGYQIAEVTDYNNYAENKANARFIAACSPSAIRSLLARVEEVERDAKRYQWLRKNPIRFSEGVAHFALHVDDEIESIVDAALSEQASKEQSHG